MQVPIYQTTSFVFKDAEEATGRFALLILVVFIPPWLSLLLMYWMLVWHNLKGGAGGIAVASGSAAITYSILNVANAGDNIVAASTL